MKTIIQVLLPTLQNKSTFDYYSTEISKVGTIVRVPFRNKELEGIIWADTKSNDKVPAAKIKDVLQTFEGASLSSHLLKFIKFISEYNLIPLGSVLKLFFPFPNLNFLNKKENCTYTNTRHNLPTLNDEQAIALEKIRAGTKQTPIKPVLLEGVTGSGKTEVYLHTICDALAQDTAQALVLLPEIMLTNHLLERFKKNLGTAAAVWHSGISLKDKKQIWKKVLNGSCRLVIGARSALFLPFKNLKLIVVDEEHDQSYKQEDGLVYNARDMAVTYGHIAQVPVILSSATPSLETFHNVMREKYSKAELTSRYHNVSPPKISIVNMKEEELAQSKWLSKTLIDKTTKTLEQGDQVILFLNRKGYAPITFCRACEHKLSCPHCSIHLVMYKEDSHNEADTRKLLCHHCGHQTPYPASCPACEAQDTLINCGPGVDRLLEEAKKLWPDKNIQSVTRDSIQKNNNSEDILNEMISSKIDILIGTQVLSKGYHFPNLNLVGVIDADIGLSGADLKATERTHQLLTQVSGRSGRETKGEVLIQTYNPDNPLLTALKTHNKKMFYNEELLSRQMMTMPPFSKLVALIFSGTDEEKLKTTVKNFAAQIPYVTGIEVLGPAPAPLAKIRKHYRYRFLIKAAQKINLQKYIYTCLNNFKLPNSIRLKTDFDPCNFL
jgi:primosomal protein N' (replication factor Y) (superfamily II helicase)